MSFLSRLFGPPPPSQADLIIDRLLSTLASQHQAQQATVDRFLDVSSEYMEAIRRQHDLWSNPGAPLKPRLMTPADEARLEQNRAVKPAIQGTPVSLDSLLSGFEQDFLSSPNPHTPL